jgi:hypothetical protein
LAWPAGHCLRAACPTNEIAMRCWWDQVTGARSSGFFAAVVDGHHCGKTGPLDVRMNDASFRAYVPMLCTGLCDAAESATIGHPTGNAIDRRNAEEAAAKRMVLGCKEVLWPHTEEQRCSCWCHLWRLL